MDLNKKKELKNIKCFLLDMDGTFYLGNRLIEGSRDFIDKCKQSGIEYFFFTNNSSRNARYYQNKIEKMGIKVPLERIITAGEVTANYIKQKKEGATVYLVGTSALEEDFIKAGLKIITNKEEKVDYLVVGFDTTLNYKKIWDAHDLILREVSYLATNPDYVCPLDQGKTMPDCGAIISLLKTSTGKEPLVIGKPNTFMVDYITDRFNLNPEEMAIIGDRLYTDIQMAINARITSIIVLSGETRSEDLDSSMKKPDFVFPSIRELSEFLYD